MSSIRLNGQYVLIKDIEKKDFAAFVNLVLPKIQPTGSIPHLAANVLAELLAEGKAQTDPAHASGLRDLRITRRQEHVDRWRDGQCDRRDANRRRRWT